MSVASGTPDPRPQFAVALDQIERRVDASEPDDFGRPTPCAEYDVRTLLAHLVGGDMTLVPDPADDVTGDEGAAFRHARADLERVWASDADLAKSYTLAWGTMTGHELLDAYTHEFTVHAWDLSRATGASNDLDPVLAEVALDWFTRNVPAEDRSDGGPFAPVVAVPDDADVYIRLAAYVGRPV